MSLADLPLPLRDNSIDDMALLRLYVDERSQQAFAELVERHASWIRSACRRALRDRELADDATQAVFMILARKAALLSENTRVSGWLYRTTRFVVSDIRKRETRHRRRQSMAMQAAIERGGDAIYTADPALRHGSRDAIAHVLSLLPEHERQAVALHFFEGLTFREIGEALGLSRDGAKKRVARALARLRVSLPIKTLSIAATAVATAMLRSASTAEAVITATVKAITTPGLTYTNLTRLLAGGLRLAGAQVAANIGKLTALRAVATTAAVATAVVYGTNLTSLNNKPATSHSSTSSFARAHTSRPLETSNDAIAGGYGGAPLMLPSAPRAGGALPQYSIPEATGALAQRSSAPMPRSSNTAASTASAASRSLNDPFVRPPVVERPVSERFGSSTPILASPRSSAKSESDDRHDDAGQDGRHVLDAGNPSTPTQPTSPEDPDQVASGATSGATSGASAGDCADNRTGVIAHGSNGATTIRTGSLPGDANIHVVLNDGAIRISDTDGISQLLHLPPKVSPKDDKTSATGNTTDDSKVASANDGDKAGSKVQTTKEERRGTLEVSRKDDHLCGDDSSSTDGKSTTNSSESRDDRRQLHLTDAHGSHTARHENSNYGLLGLDDKANGKGKDKHDDKADGSTTTGDDNDHDGSVVAANGNDDESSPFDDVTITVPNGTPIDQVAPHATAGHGHGSATDIASSDEVATAQTIMQLLDVNHSADSGIRSMLSIHSEPPRNSSAEHNGDAGMTASDYSAMLGGSDSVSVYVGQVLPEPASIGSMGIVTLAALLKRRRR